MMSTGLVTVGEMHAFIASVFGSIRPSRDGLNVAIRCPRPECDSTRDPSKHKLVIHVERQCLHCWVCGFKARSLMPLLLRHASHEAAATYRERFLAGRVLSASESAVCPVLRLPDGFRLLACASSGDAVAQRALRYVQDRRGLDRRMLWRFRPGVCDDPDWCGRVIMPSFDAQGALSFFTGRLFEGRGVSYKNCEADKGSVVFNEINVDWSARLVLCEGPFDLVKCGENAAPLLGSSLPEEGALMDSILVNRTPVALALDADMRIRAQALGRRLSEYGIDVVMVDLGDRHDPGEMNPAEFRDRLAAARPWSWRGMLTARLDRATRTTARLH
jgi:hypothetical protein